MAEAASSWPSAHAAVCRTRTSSSRSATARSVDRRLLFTRAECARGFSPYFGGGVLQGTSNRGRHRRRRESTERRDDAGADARVVDPSTCARAAQRPARPGRRRGRQRRRDERPPQGPRASRSASMWHLLRSRDRHSTRPRGRRGHGPTARGSRSAVSSGADAGRPSRPSARAASSAGDVPHGTLPSAAVHDVAVGPLASAVDRLNVCIVGKQFDQARDGGDPARRAGQARVAGCASARFRAAGCYRGRPGLCTGAASRELP